MDIPRSLPKSLIYTVEADNCHLLMSEMEEISFWIQTKRAPCLMNYVNTLKRDSEISCSKPKSVPSVNKDVPSPIKKKKRKLPILDDESEHYVKSVCYFETSQEQHQKTFLTSCKSDTDSDIDFNIKNSSLQNRPKKIKKKSRTTFHKKNKVVVTSTPKTTLTLRRSLRKAQQTNNHCQLNCSLDIFNNTDNQGPETCNEQAYLQINNSNLAIGDKINKSIKLEDTNGRLLNGKYEDLSDVSGLTANYIRSTKNIKTPRKLKGKPNSNLVNKLHSDKPDSKMLVCVNKSVNTGHPNNTVLNCSTDSSQNIINLVTAKNGEKPSRNCKATSVLKFIEPKCNKRKLNQRSVQKQCSPKYRTRNSNNTTHESLEVPDNSPCKARTRNTKRSSARKENPDLRRRSSRHAGSKPPEDSVLVFNDSAEQKSSNLSMNVASGVNNQSSKRTMKKRYDSVNKSRHSTRKESLRDKSGFAACFSDSDEEQSKGRKFFC